MNTYQETLNKAVQLHQTGWVQDAIRIYRKLLRKHPANAHLLFLLGMGNAQIGQVDLAIEHLERSLIFDSVNPVVRYNLGMVYQSRLQMPEALENYDAALALRPDYADAYNNRGNVLVALHRFDDALASYEQALIFKPDYVAAYSNKGNVLKGLNRFEEALASYDKALELKPDYVEAYYNRGVALNELGRLDEALESYDRALALKPDYSAAYNNRANTLSSVKRFEEAMASYDRALTLEPNNAEMYWNKSLLLILLGQYAEGWKLFEWRFKKMGLENEYDFAPHMRWRGQTNIRGKRLLVQAEQGFGDVIQFCRYLPQIEELGAEIILELPTALIPIISTMNCQMTVIQKGAPRLEIDAYCPIMSLPYAFKTTVDTIPAQIPYLFSDKKKVQIWQQKLGRTEKMKVGLVWSGSETHKNDRNRSIVLNEIRALIDLPIEFHSLQKEYRPHDLNVLSQLPEIHQHQHELNDFSDTAALIECIDLVISVDTSVAHVAAAIGRPVWILLPFVPDYRWALDRDDSPWYPTVKLFRQPSIGDWTAVIRTVFSELKVKAHAQKTELKDSCANVSTS